MSPHTPELRVLVLPNQDGDLVFPTGTVAEIVRTQTLAPPQGQAPSWVIGNLDWRGCPVPVIRMATSTPLARTQTQRSYLIVCFAPGQNERLPFIAIESPGLPRLEHITAADLAPDPEERAAAPLFVSQALRLRGKPSWLPDLDAAEQALLD